MRNALVEGRSTHVPPLQIAFKYNLWLRPAQVDLLLDTRWVT